MKFVTSRFQIRRGESNICMDIIRHLRRHTTFVAARGIVDLIWTSSLVCSAQNRLLDYLCILSASSKEEALDSVDIHLCLLMLGDIEWPLGIISSTSMPVVCKKAKLQARIKPTALLFSNWQRELNRVLVGFSTLYIQLLHGYAP